MQKALGVYGQVLRLVRRFTKGLKALLRQIRTRKLRQLQRC
ncbi:hypothetical protein OIU74_009136 [Salix koriyanagi]|uniref:Uncharacterized protein n=1 Tax=Salix koriyanagi TaxID=2511006 RepID=A0A9Q0TRN1_9ROSI|nr:hypothetical protein OIU74_009136 [Salix koriyanagi]